MSSPGHQGPVLYSLYNVGTTEVLLYPRICLGVLNIAQVVSLSPGVTEVRSVTATISSQLTVSPVHSEIEALDLSDRTRSDRG